MLKFIRKFQLPILVVGGSLLMVVFLLEPVLTRLSPSQANAKIATLASGKKITAGDRQMAQFELDVLKNIYPQILQPRNQGGVGFDPDSSKRVLHWIMLSNQAMDAGLVGDAADGRALIAAVADQTAMFSIRQQTQQGLITQVEAETQYPILVAQFTTQLNNRVASLSGMVPSINPDDVLRILAKAQGIMRLVDLYYSTPALSDLGARKAAHTFFDAIAVNAATIPASVFTSTIADPTEEELQAFFDLYKDKFIKDTEFAIGYQQPTRVRLAYLKMDRQMLFNAAKIDRVELVKLHKKNTDPDKGDFASARPALERKYRDDQATKMMIEADRLIRSLVQQSVKGLPSTSGRYELPEDWDTRRPQLEKIAESVVTGLNEQFGVRLPTLSINVFGSDWLNADQINALPGFGTATYRVGSKQFPAPLIPAMINAKSSSKGLIVQPGLPLADPAATDAEDNRYYAVILEINESGPSHSIDDAGRQRVLKDYKEIKAYKTLINRTDELHTILASTGEVSDALNAAITTAAEGTTTPNIQSNILVTRETVNTGRMARFIPVNPAINIPAFRDAVLDATDSLDPLTKPDAIDNESRAITVALPASRSLALATIVAPRPMTTEQFQARSNQVLFTQIRTELADAIESNPFSFDALSTRLGLVVLKDLKDEDS
ncbi:MAG: hypothetical protein JKY96_01290 [Phycisphaerales bacterium]|nr:hypothetical protein [Phycisphaerales bacterium]